MRGGLASTLVIVAEDRAIETAFNSRSSAKYRGGVVSGEATGSRGICFQDVEEAARGTMEVFRVHEGYSSREGEIDYHTGR